MGKTGVKIRLAKPSERDLEEQEFRGVIKRTGCVVPRLVRIGVSLREK